MFKNHSASNFEILVMVLYLFLLSRTLPEVLDEHQALVFCGCDVRGLISNNQVAIAGRT